MHRNRRQVRKLSILRDSVFANGDADAQWTISIPKTYSKPILYSYPNPYTKPNPSLIPKFDKKCLKRNRSAVYGKRRICEFQDITGSFGAETAAHKLPMLPAFLKRGGVWI